MTNPETALIQKLAEVRTALTEEREALLARVSAIDEALALGTVPAKPETKAAKEPKSPKGKGIRETISLVLAGRPNMTIREVQAAIPEHSPKSVEATVRAMAAGGQLTKDQSTPRKFALPAAHPAPKAGQKANGSSASV